MHMVVLKRLVGAIIVVVFCNATRPQFAFALTEDGQLDTTSTGYISVSTAIDSRVRISDVEDSHSFGSYSGTGNLSWTDTVCVWTNVAGATYRVTAKGKRDGDTSFTLKKQNAADLIPYSVGWKAGTGGGSFSDLPANDPQGPFSGANTTAIDCGGPGGNNATFQVTITQGDLLSHPAGTYEGILSLVVSPGT